MSYLYRGPGQGVSRIKALPWPVFPGPWLTSLHAAAENSGACWLRVAALFPGRPLRERVGVN